MNNIIPNKYPEIITDKTRNSALNASKILSIEEYNDLMHHTHDLSTLILSSGDHAGDDMNSTINAIYTLINDLISRVEALEQYVQQDIQFQEGDPNNNSSISGD